MSTESVRAGLTGMVFKSPRIHLRCELLGPSEKEWGFPKGRRNFQEKDIVCGIREFEEETGYNINDILDIKYIMFMI